MDFKGFIKKMICRLIQFPDPKLRQQAEIEKSQDSRRKGCPCLTGQTNMSKMRSAFKLFVTLGAMAADSFYATPLNERMTANSQLLSD